MKTWFFRNPWVYNMLSRFVDAPRINAELENLGLEPKEGALVLTLIQAFERIEALENELYHLKRKVGP